MSPFYEKLTFELEFITPAFIGGAFPDEEAELRPASFIGILRWWFRNLALTVTDDIEAIAHLESELFGNQKRAGKVWIKAELKRKLKIEQLKKEFSYFDYFTTNYKINSKERFYPFVYVGYGPLNTRVEKIRPFFWVGEKFHINFFVPRKYKPLLESLLFLVSHLGAIGSRKRRGWGSFILKPLEDNFSNYFSDKENWIFFNKGKLDIGREHFRSSIEKLLSKRNNKNSSGLLDIQVLPTKFKSDKWDQILKDFAEVYRNYRRSLDYQVLKDLIIEFFEPKKTSGSYIRFSLGLPIYNIYYKNLIRKQKITQPLKDFIIEFFDPKKTICYRRFYFGLPISNICYNSIIRKYKIKNKSRVFIKDKNNQRRASPLLFKVVKTFDDSYQGIVIFWKGTFLPSYKQLYKKVLLEIKCEKEKDKNLDVDNKPPCFSKKNALSKQALSIQIYLKVDTKDMEEVISGFINEIKEENNGTQQ
jgi:CRISPR-associated protein Cmr1